MGWGSRRRDRAGFTLVELLVVLLIVAIIAGVTLPVVIPAISHRQVSESARIIQGGLIVARDSALRTNSPHGIRFLPDPTYNGLNPKTGLTDIAMPLAFNRFIPIEQPPGYSEGKAWMAVPGEAPLTPNKAFGPARWDNDTILASGVSAYDAYYTRRVLMLVQATYSTEVVGGTANFILESPTSWYWNVRVGDKVQINNQGRYYTVVGPMQEPNSEMFVNVGDLGGTLRLDDPYGNAYHPEVLFLVDGVDGDGDGYIDNGWDGFDNDGNNAIDELGEWSEEEKWVEGSAPAVDAIAPTADWWAGLPYRIVRQPVPSPGARETILPESVVVDATGWSLTQPERSRLPLDSLSRTADVLLDPAGRVIPTTRYSSPTSVGMGASFYHIWVGERSDTAEIPAVRDPVTNNVLSINPLLASGVFYLPMPLGQNVETLTENANSYDALVEANPTLPTLKGEMRLLTLSARSGNLITTDRPTFSITNPSQPYRAPQMGIQGDAP